MARMTKNALIEALKDKEISFDPKANYNDLYRLLNPVEKQTDPQILTTQSAYETPMVKETPVPKGSQCCGRCKSYKFHPDKGFLVCEKRGGRRGESAGSDCEKFERE